jgi:hypothetical protein
MQQEAMNMAKELRKTKDHPDVKAMEEQRDERTRLNEEAMERMDSSQPTPTQEENDLARLGVQVDEKEPDGSGPTIITRTIVANTPLGYDTRSVEAKESERQRQSGQAGQSRQSGYSASRSKTETTT